MPQELTEAMGSIVLDSISPYRNHRLQGWSWAAGNSGIVTGRSTLVTNRQYDSTYLCCVIFMQRHFTCTKCVLYGQRPLVLDLLWCFVIMFFQMRCLISTVPSQPKDHYWYIEKQQYLLCFNYCSFFLVACFMTLTNGASFKSVSRWIWF